MDYKYRISQDELKRLYENAKERMDAHPELADNYEKIIQEYPFFESEKDALQSALKMMNDKFSDCQIWAKVEKDDDIFRIRNWWIVTDDWKIKQAADYLAMALMYDNVRLLDIINNNNIEIDDVVAYY